MDDAFEKETENMLSASMTEGIQICACYQLKM